jgi:hypothetical protein
MPVGVGDRETFALPPALWEREMTSRYYFDLRNGDDLIVDEDGEVHLHLGAAQDEAVRSLACLIRDAVGKSTGSLTELAIEVRDDNGPVMHAKFTLQVLRKN